MGPLVNNTPSIPQTPKPDGGGVTQTTLPTADVSAVRSAAMGAATAGMRSDAQTVTSEPPRSEQIRIIIGGDNPVLTVLAACNGGRGVPFTPQEIRDARVIIDTLSRLADQDSIRHPGVRLGELRNSPGFNHPRHPSHTSAFLSNKTTERPSPALHQASTTRDNDRGRDAPQGAHPEHSRQTQEPPQTVKETTATEHRKETLTKVEIKATDQTNPLGVERPVTWTEKAPVGEQPAMQPTHSPTTPDISRPPEASRTQENQQLAQETSNLVNAAIATILNDSRNDTARLVTQVLTNDAVTRPQLDTSTPTVATPLSYSNPFEARERVQEKLSQIRETLQTVIERSSPVAGSSTQSTPAANHSYAQSAVGDYSRFEVPRQNVKPGSAIEMQGRGVPDRNGFGPSPLHLHGSPALRAAGFSESTAIFAPLEKGTVLVDALSKSTRKILNIQLLHKLDRALETVVISGAAAIALGVIGAEVILKQLTALSRELLARLRESGPFTKEEEVEHQRIEEMLEDFEQSCRELGIEKEKDERSTGLVADITGVIVFSTSGLPVEGVLIDAGSLGTTMSNTFGEFRLTNIPLETGFSLTCHDNRYSFFPNPLVGTVSTMNHFIIQATKRP